jgi:hypothetical protein
MKTDSQEIVDLKALDEKRRRDNKKQKLNNEFQIILPLNFTFNDDFLNE